jgi:protein SCO1
MLPRSLSLPVRVAVIVLALLLAAGAGLRIAFGGSSKTSVTRLQGSEGVIGGSSGFDGAALPGRPAPSFTLLDQDHRPASPRAYRGQVVLLAFLDSTCGADCTLLAQQVRGALDELTHPVPALFVTVDPHADTPASVSRFLRAVSLDGRVRYLSGSAARLRAVWRAYHIVAPSASASSAGAASGERFATVVLIDRHGLERVAFGVEQLTPEGLAHDIRRLQAE